MRLLRTLGITMLGMALLPGIAQAEVAWKLRSETSIPLRLADYCMASYAPNGQQSLRLARNSLGQMAILFTPDDPANWRTANASPVQILLGKKLLRQANAIIAANGEVNLPLGREEKWLSEITDQPLTFKQGSASQTYQLPNLNSVTTQLRTCINSAWAQQPDTGGLPSAIEPVLRQASWPDAHILLDKSDKNNEKYLIKSQDSYVRLSSLRSRETLDNLLLSKIDPLEPQCRGYFQSTLSLPAEYPNGTAVKAELACHYQGDPTRAWLLLYQPKSSSKIWEFFIESPEASSSEAITLVNDLETALGQESE